MKTTRDFLEHTLDDDGECPSGCDVYEGVCDATPPKELQARHFAEVLAAALPEVTGEQVNLAGWTCNGIHEPGDYSTCEDCRDACDDLANFYNNMMQQPKADGPWTGRPEVKP